jgi:hypothetical protein
MTNREQALHILRNWWDALPTYKHNNGLPAQGTLASALVVLDRLQQSYSLALENHTVDGGVQIAGLGRSKTTQILARFNREPLLLKECGRTNMGIPSQMCALLNALASLKLDALSQAERNAVLVEMQRWLVVERVSDYFSRERVKFDFIPEQTAWQTVHDILAAAKMVGKEGQIAQYLVGAKLALRFPDAQVRNDSYSTSDAQSGLPGDFVLGSTVFHVTVSPMPAHYDKCKANVHAGYDVFLLVPDRLVVGARQNTEGLLPGRISVQSIEAFVSQNLEELSGFARPQRKAGFRTLLETYNSRVDAIESDKSLLIEIPQNLSG